MITTMSFSSESGLSLSSLVSLFSGYQSCPQLRRHICSFSKFIRLSTQARLYRFMTIELSPLDCNILLSGFWFTYWIRMWIRWSCPWQLMTLASTSGTTLAANSKYRTYLLLVLLYFMSPMVLIVWMCVCHPSGWCLRPMGIWAAISLTIWFQSTVLYITLRYSLLLCQYAHRCRAGLY